MAAHRVELAVIAAPTGRHAGLLREVLAAGQVRLVLCEKPLAPEPEAARAMIADCAAQGVQLFVNYFRRSLPGAIEVRRRLDDGRIAAGGKAVSWYGKGFVHNGSHFLDLLRYWLGEVRSVLPLGPPREGAAGAEIDCHLRMERGEAVMLAGWDDRYSHFALELLAPNGRLSLEPSLDRLSWQPVVPDPATPGYHALSAQGEEIDTGMARYQWHVAEQLSRHIAGEPASLCAGDEALAVLETMHAAIAAARGTKA
jgi:predicted dehydrogenase